MTYKSIQLFLPMLSACLSALGQISVNTSQDVFRPGDALPDSFYRMKHRSVNVLTGHMQDIRLEDYRDQLVILDFWFNGCKPCMVSLNKLDSIRAARGDDRWVVFPFTYQSAEASKHTFDRFKWGFTSIVSDTVLRKLFTGEGFQNMVWIKDGKVVATPPSSFATWENIEKVLDGEQPSMPLRAEMRLALDPARPIFTGDNGPTTIRYEQGGAKIGGYVPDYKTTYLTTAHLADTTVLYCSNLTMDELLLQAFADEIQPGTPPEEALVWDIGPERKDVFRVESPSVAKARNLDDYTRIQQWREAYLYGYTRRVARNLSENAAARIVQQDLNAYLGSRYNLEAAIKNGPPRRYPVLKCIGSMDNTLARLSDEEDLPDRDKETIVNRQMPFASHLLSNIALACRNGTRGEVLPLVDSTGIAADFPVSFHIPKGMTEGWTVERINREIRRYGLKVVMKEDRIPLLYVSERPPVNNRSVNH
ncbi:peroxiredoxin family protein [Parapedobacter sp. GCM10030251]|uniref:peroxiredoxin family protein n=1 Tax=Parapedobacter sp. GCM10030251 TaxID=3273419 RepID=UPI00361C345F